MKPRRTSLVLALVLSLARGAGADPSPKPYVTIVPDWPILAVADRNVAAGDDYRTHTYYSWNGHALRLIHFDDSGSESFSWEPKIAGVNSAGTVVGEESEAFPASTSGISSETERRALGVGPMGRIPVSSKSSTLTGVDEAGDIAGVTLDGAGFIARRGGDRLRFPAPRTGRFTRSYVPGSMSPNGNLARTSSLSVTVGTHTKPATAPWHVFLLTAGRPPSFVRDLGVVPGCARPSIAGINDRGEIVGNCVGDTTLAWHWANGAFAKLEPVAGRTESYVAGIAKDGLVAGTSSTDSDRDATIWRKGRLELVAGSIGDGTADHPLFAVDWISPGGWMVVETAGDHAKLLIVPATERTFASAFSHGPALPTSSP